MKFCLAIFLSLLILFFFSSSIFAAGFQLKTIGALNVEGATLTQLWYSSENVTFTGTALENASVTATIDGTSETVTADASGNWSYTASLSEGDHQVSFVSDGSSISFTLTIGEPPADIGSLPTTATPAGTIEPTIAILFLGIASIASGVLLLKKDFLRA